MALDHESHPLNLLDSSDEQEFDDSLLLLESNRLVQEAENNRAVLKTIMPNDCSPHRLEVDKDGARMEEDTDDSPNDENSHFHGTLDDTLDDAEDDQDDKIISTNQIKRIEMLDGLNRLISSFKNIKERWVVAVATHDLFYLLFPRQHVRREV